jgi:hypothetical protein
MHDSLSLRLFFPLTLAIIFQHRLESEVIMAPWRLLNAALTLPRHSTTTRVDLLSVGCRFLFFHFKLGEKCGYAPNVHVKITPGQPAQSYTRKQLRDAINIFIALITIVRTSDNSVALDCIGSSPLEHAFGNMRIRCRDVHTLEKMIAAFASIELASVIPFLLNLQRIPPRHLSMEVRCESFIHSEHLIFTLGPKAIAIALFLCAGIDLSRIDVAPYQIEIPSTNCSKSINFIGGWASGSRSTGWTCT